MENKIKSFEDFRLKNFIDIDDLKNKLEKYLELRLPISDELAILEQQKRDVYSAYSAWNTACKMKDEEIEKLMVLQTKLEAKNYDLQKEIEKMKCCGNCQPAGASTTTARLQTSANSA